MRWQQLAGDGVAPATVDAAGNLTQDGDSNGNHKYTWDYRNRLIEVEACPPKPRRRWEKQSGNWNTTGEYKYDAWNRRVLKSVTNKPPARRAHSAEAASAAKAGSGAMAPCEGGGSLNGTTRFIWGGDPSTALGAGWQCREERDSAGDLVARFTYAPGYIDAVAVQERDFNADTDFADANEIVYYHANTLFSVYALSDASGTIVERYRYDAYGGATVLDADGSVDGDGLSDVGNPYRFTGRRLDPESGVLQYRYRYYHTGLGRFLTRDPGAAQPEVSSLPGSSSNGSSPDSSREQTSGACSYMSSAHRPLAGLLPDLYEYCVGLPTTRVDPYGLVPTPSSVFECYAGFAIEVAVISLGESLCNAACEVTYHALTAANLSVGGAFTGAFLVAGHPLGGGVVVLAVAVRQGLAIYLRKQCHNFCKTQADEATRFANFHLCMCLAAVRNAVNPRPLADPIAALRCLRNLDSSPEREATLKMLEDIQEWIEGGAHGFPPHLPIPPGVPKPA